MGHRNSLATSFGGRVNSETLISCFMLNLSNKMSLTKQLWGFMRFFTYFFSTSVQYKCCYGNIVDNISIKASANNDL